MISGANEQELELANARADILLLQQENQSLKKQLEEKDTLVKQCEISVSNIMDCYCERTDCSGRIKDSKQYDSLVQKLENQQKEFIEYLENKIKRLKEVDENKISQCSIQTMRCMKSDYQEILSKYKAIIGVSNEK